MISVLTNQSSPIANVRYFLERYRPNKTARLTLFFKIKIREGFYTSSIPRVWTQNYLSYTMLKLSQ